MKDRPTQQDVLFALLAYDAYNRGADAQLLNGPGATNFLSTQIGTAAWEYVSDTKLQGATAVGFSASKYTLSSGQTVISYRGTDFHFGSREETLGFYGDSYRFQPSHFNS